MTVIQAIILGLIQGFTEFIPVSSSGHLLLAHHFLNINATGLSFDVALHIGTLLALLIYFYKDLWQLAVAIFKRQPEARLAWLLALATVPAVIAGVLLESSAEHAFRSPKLVAINLAVVAVLMLVAERYYHRRVLKPTKLDKVSLKQSVMMGVAQSAALIPGVSRSGITITTGLFAGMDRVAATRFSFLLGIPITAGAILKVLSEQHNAQLFSGQEGHMALIGIITAFISGMFAIRFLLRYLGKHSLAIFAYYRLGVTALVLLLLVVR
jgi:undecaprenyl-diphosphatase